MEGKLQRADGNGAEAPVAARHPERAPGGPALARLALRSNGRNVRLADTRRCHQSRDSQICI